MIRDKVIEKARSFIGIRWRHQGRTKDGLDCVGLVVCSLNECGMQIEDFTGYSRRPTNMAFINYFIERGGVHAKRSEMDIGDILIFSERSYPCHTGFLSSREGKPTLIHAYLPSRKVVEESFSDIWKRKLVAAITLPRYK